jgi:hypothetical protein
MILRVFRNKIERIFYYEKEREVTSTPSNRFVKTFRNLILVPTPFSALQGYPFLSP